MGAVKSKGRIAMKKMIASVTLVLLFSAVFLVSATVGWCADTDIEFYNGKIVRLIVPAKAGEMFDRWTRIIAPALEKQLAGCRVVVINIPGGGRMPGTNQVYKAKPDGLTIGLLYRASLISQLIGEEGVNYDFAKFTWLGNLSEEPRYLVVSAKSPYRSVADIGKAKEFKFGCTGIGSFDWYDTTLLTYIFGWKQAKTVVGFSDSFEILGAILKGEVQGYMAIGDQARGLDLSDYRIIMEEGAPGGKVSKNPFGKIETLVDIAPKGVEAYVKFIYGLYYLAKPVCAPPGLPEGKTKVLRTALKNITKDPWFLEAASKNGFNVVFTDGDALDTLMDDYIAKMPKEVIELLKASSKAGR
jgi:tripartite-type tricarboxylate transporter receptor subunit TctC